MKQETATAIENAAGLQGIEVRAYHGYSGRGMRGKEVSGVVGSIGDIIHAVAHATAELSEPLILDFDRPDNPEKIRDDFIADLKNLSMDFMGRDTIIY